MPELALFSVVALTEDVEELSLSRGQMGIVVASLGPGVYEVEFSSESGETCAMAPIESGKLLRLHRAPVSDAA